MKEGILQSGTATGLYRHPQSRFVMEFLGAANFFPGVDGKTVALRPEDLRFSNTGALEGIILRQEFYGFYREYLVRTAQGNLTVLAGKGTEYVPEDEARLNFKEEHTLLLHKRGAEL